MKRDWKAVSFNLARGAAFAALFLVPGAWAQKAQEAAPRKAKYVFLMIGDGLSSVQRSAAQYFKTEMAKGKQFEGEGVSKLLMNEFPVQGLCATYSKNSIITDSAAASTAMATGKKTNSGVISMSPNGAESFKTVAEVAKEDNMKVGVISSVSIDHATPACFYSHKPSRKMYYEIAMDLSKSGFDYFGGGQAKGALPSKVKGRENPVDAAKKAGYEIVDNKDKLMALKPKTGQKIWAYTPHVDKDAAMYYAIDRVNKNWLTLADFTSKAIELLDNPNGFFLMVEGGKIDWCCHQNDAATMVWEVLAFDKSVQVAYDFYKKHPEDTLIVVVGDHETGGLSIGGTRTEYKAYPLRVKDQKMSQLEFEDVVDELRIKHVTFEKALPKLKDIFGFQKLSSRDLEALERAYEASMKGDAFHDQGGAVRTTYGSYEPLGVACTQILNKQAGLSWTSFYHTGVPVQVSAIGAGQDLFTGYYDNTAICAKILSLLPKAKTNAVKTTNAALPTTRHASERQTAATF